MTGIATDRLKEEKSRGISIELGFAYIDLPNGQRCGLIDVPGHEKFVRHMIAGASGIDLVMFVVAADEGVMQQTREHLDICSLLGIEKGLIVLTKVDLVDEEWLDLVESDLEDTLSGTFLDGAPIVRFSAMDDTTLPGMKTALFNAIDALAPISDDSGLGRPTRLPIDRVFTMRGFGTVVTGTLSSGCISTGDMLELQPTGLQAKVRGIESHGSPVNSATRGQRVAINLAGIDVSEISRGDVLSHPGLLEASRMLDVDLRLLPHAPRAFGRHTKVLAHVGTKQVNGTVVLLDRDVLEPGESAPIQLRLDKWAVALGGDRVIIRGFQMLPQHGKTLGGGIIRHPVAVKHKRQDSLTVSAAFSAWRGSDLAEAVTYTLALAGRNGAPTGLVQQVHSLSDSEAKTVLTALCEARRAYQYMHDGAVLYVDSTRFVALVQRAQSILADYHTSHTHRPGMPREELRSRLRPDLPPKYYGAILDVLTTSQVVDISERWVKLHTFEPALNAALKRVQDELLHRLVGSGLEPPDLSSLSKDVAQTTKSTANDVYEVIELLVDQGQLARVQERLVFAVQHIETLEAQVVDYIQRHGEMSTPQLKELTGASRKFTVPLGEYLDSKRLTIRVGDVRKLRGA